MPATTRSMQITKFFQMIENYACWDVEMPEIMDQAYLLGLQFRALHLMTPEMRSLSIKFFDWVEQMNPLGAGAHLYPSMIPEEVAFRAYDHYNPCTFEVYRN